MRVKCEICGDRIDTYDESHSTVRKPAITPSGVHTTQH